MRRFDRRDHGKKPARTPLIRTSWPAPLEAWLAWQAEHPVMGGLAGVAGPRPTNKRLGQHFLLEPRVLDATVSAACMSETDTVVEIGAGCGILTEKLLASAGKVIALEIDSALVAFLREYFADAIAGGRLEIREQDARLFEPPTDEPYTIVGNIPYYLTSPLIRRLIDIAPAPRGLTFLIQKEVAERICAHPGQLNLLGLAVQLGAHPRMITQVEPDDFYPPPEVLSAVIQIDIPPAPPHPITREERAQLMALAQLAFSKKRKTLANAIESDALAKPVIKEIVRGIGLRDDARPQDLSIEQWILLTRAVGGATLKK